MEKVRERKNFVVCLMTISFFHVLFFLFHSSQFLRFLFLKVKHREKTDLWLLTTVTHPLH